MHGMSDRGTARESSRPAPSEAHQPVRDHHERGELQQMAGARSPDRERAERGDRHGRDHREDGGREHRLRVGSGGLITRYAIDASDAAMSPASAAISVRSRGKNRARYSARCAEDEDPGTSTARGERSAGRAPSCSRVRRRTGQPRPDVADPDHEEGEGVPARLRDRRLNHIVTADDRAIMPATDGAFGRPAPWLPSRAAPLANPAATAPTARSSTAPHGRDGASEVFVIDVP